MLRPLELFDGTGLVSRSFPLKDTIIESFQTTTCIPLEFDYDLGGVFPGGHKIDHIVLPPSIKMGASRDSSGNIILTPILISLNEVVRGVHSNNRTVVERGMKRFLAAYKAAVAKSLQEKVGRLRVTVSGALVAIPHINHSSFKYGRFKSGDFSALKPGEIGLSTKVMDRMNNKKSITFVDEHGRTSTIKRRNIVGDGDYGIFSRWPTTGAKSCTVREVPGQDFVIFVSPSIFKMGDRVMSQMDLVEGDCDGDTPSIIIPRSREAKSELAWHKIVAMGNLQPMAVTPQAMTWKDHEDLQVDPLSSVVDAIEQKLWISNLSLIYYAGFAVIDMIENCPIDYQSWSSAMTAAIELCFDKKHNNQSDPRGLYGLLRGLPGYSWEKVESSLSKQGLDTATFRAMYEILEGGDIREKANHNLAFAILHGNSMNPPVWEFMQSVPEETTMAEWFQNTLIASEG
jgi:hypothetical protein